MKAVYFICAVVLSFSSLYGQVGVGTTQPDTSSVLDVYSTSKGVLLPRMNTTKINAISLPAEGLLVFNTDSQHYQINQGSESNPNWLVLKQTDYQNVPAVFTACDLSYFSGVYSSNTTFTSSNTFTVKITNNGFVDVDIPVSTSDVQISGMSGISISAVSGGPTVTIQAQQTQEIVYTLSGTPSNGALNCTWQYMGLRCFKSINISTNILPSISSLQEVKVWSAIHTSPSVDHQGIIDNSSNKITVNIPYNSGGSGNYEAYTSDWVENHISKGEFGDINKFRLTHPSGSFSPSGGVLPVTIEIGDDGTFNVRKMAVESETLIVSLPFEVNGTTLGVVKLYAAGGILDRNFDDANHKFVYMPVVAKDGKTWLSNNLGANYTNINHTQFNLNKQATAFNDYNAYGSLFQWGRYSDGHELINSTDSTTSVAVNGTTSTTTTSNTPNNSLFITNSSGDWRVPSNDNLWQGVNGVNNPCPEGYRIPTNTEIYNLASLESITNASTAINSTLALVSNGFRASGTGEVRILSNYYYWTSTVTVTGNNVIGFVSPISGFNASPPRRSYGFSVRCVKN